MPIKKKITYSNIARVFQGPSTTYAVGDVLYFDFTFSPTWAEITDIEVEENKSLSKIHVRYASQVQAPLLLSVSPAPPRYADIWRVYDIYAFGNETYKPWVFGPFRCNQICL